LKLTLEATAMAKQVEFFFDYGSPFSYLADTQIAGLLQRTGAQIIYKPMLLGGVFKATGNASPITIPAKGKYMSADLPMWAAHYGVPMKMNPFFPINTIRIMRGAVAAQSAGCFPAYHSTMFRAMWAEGVNLGDANIVKAIFTQLGMDPDAVERDDVKERLRANTDEAVARGAFGAPTFFVGDAMFWGNDRMHFVEAALK
jgi:2-hydroxychromene-2-carboxylate isomerase